MQKRIPFVSCLAAALFVAGVPDSYGQSSGTPPELVSAYDSLADSILSAKNSEWHMVQAILAVAYGDALTALRDAKSAIDSDQDSRAAVETLADLVAQLGNEGDAAVAAIRKRLIEGGHHHNASGEQQGIYDPGFVIVTREAKKLFLDAAGNIGRSAAKPDAGVLDTEWKRVSDQYQMLSKAN